MNQQLSYRRLPFAADLPLGAGEADRAAGALLGLALGDALGAPRENVPVFLSRLRYGREPTLSRGVLRFMRLRGTVTDDTQLTYLVAKAIRKDRFDEEAFRASLADWWNWRIGAGGATERAVRGRPDNRSQGNGAAMRIAPIVLLHHGLSLRRGGSLVSSDPAMLDAVARSARVTHPNSEAIAGAEAVARVTAFLLTTSSESPDLADVAFPATATRDPTLWQERLAEAVDASSSSRILGGPGWVPSTVAQAIHLLVRHGNNWREALRQLFDAGGDTDTVAAIYLSWVGARWGATTFGVELLRDVQGAGVLLEESRRLMGPPAGSNANTAIRTE